MIVVRTEIEIRATPEAVWEALTDFPRYPDWNPFLPRAEGKAVEGTVLDVRIEPPGLKPCNQRLKVLEVLPLRRLRWLGHWWLPGMMDGDHVFKIEHLEPTRVQLVQAETFRGILTPFLAPWLKRNLPAGFEAMNQALKGQVELGASRASP